MRTFNKELCMKVWDGKLAINTDNSDIDDILELLNYIKHINNSDSPVFTKSCNLNFLSQKVIYRTYNNIWHGMIITYLSEAHISDFLN